MKPLQLQNRLYNIGMSIEDFAKKLKIFRVINKPVEGGDKKYNPEEITAFEKTRIQDPEKAHDVANMVSSETEAFFGDILPVEDYDIALDSLEELQEEARHESQTGKEVKSLGEDGETLSATERLERWKTETEDFVKRRAEKDKQ